MLLFFKILFLLTSLLPADTGWQRINTDQGISFLFPNHPQKLEKLINGIPSTIYQTKDLACVAGVVCSNMSAKKVKITTEYAQLLYEELKKGTLSLETASLQEEKTIPYENMLIKEIRYTIIKDNHEMTYFKRFIFRDNYIYQITIGGRTRHWNILVEEKDTFFNSVYFPADKDENKK